MEGPPWTFGMRETDRDDDNPSFSPSGRRWPKAMVFGATCMRRPIRSAPSAARLGSSRARRLARWAAISSAVALP